MKPVPRSVNVKSRPPGATAAGISGQLTKGTGFVVPAARRIIVKERSNASAANNVIAVMDVNVLVFTFASFV
jgi:hypothetical protein